MKRRTFPKWAGRVAALVMAATLGVASTARAQTAPEFWKIGSYKYSNALPDAGSCAGPMDASIWLDFCSPVWLLPMGAPEIAFGGTNYNGTGIISYNASDGLMTITAKIRDTYFDTHGNVDYLDSARSLASTVTLRVYIDNNGKFLRGAGNACGDGGWDDFCVIGSVHTTNGITYGVAPDGTLRPLVRGRVERATNKPDAITLGGVVQDDFEYYINIKSRAVGDNGDIVNAFWEPAGLTHIVVEAFGDNSDHHVTYVGNNPFNASFAEWFVQGYTGVTSNDVGFLTNDACNGQISGTVSSLNSGPLADVSMQLTALDGSSLPAGSDGKFVTGYTGAFSYGSVCKGNYTVTATLPDPQFFTTAAGTTNPASATIALASDGINNTKVVVPFAFQLASTVSASYSTYGQGGWGAVPKGQNPGTLLKQFFPLISGASNLVTIGGTRKLTFSSQGAVQNFLPQGGKSDALSATAANPVGRGYGSLAGETLALQLNVLFSQYGLVKSGLGALHFAAGPLAGTTKTVDDVLGDANAVLGGAAVPAVYKNLDGLKDVVDKINKNYDSGTSNKGYLKL